MQDENVACHDIGKLSFERAVGCFGTPQLERGTRFPMPQLERATHFPNIPAGGVGGSLDCRMFVK